MEQEEAVSSQSIGTAVGTERGLAPAAALIPVCLLSSHPEEAGRNVTLFTKLPEGRKIWSRAKRGQRKSERK